jgi:hypothetical protein
VIGKLTQGILHVAWGSLRAVELQACQACVLVQGTDKALSVLGVRDSEKSLFMRYAVYLDASPLESAGYEITTPDRSVSRKPRPLRRKGRKTKIGEENVRKN